MTEVIDEVILAACPLLAAPQSGCIKPPAAHGTRLIVAEDGLYREVSTPWLYSLLPLGHNVLASTPYGRVGPTVRMSCGAVPAALIAQFLELAQGALPNEAAALIVWNAETRTWRLAPRSARYASAERIDYDEPALAADEIAVVDIHSHGHAPAFFSAVDDIDDSGSIKISVVIGRVQEKPEVVARLMVVQHGVMLQLKPNGEFVIAEAKA